MIPPNNVHDLLHSTYWLIATADQYRHFARQVVHSFSRVMPGLDFDIVGFSTLRDDLDCWPAPFISLGVQPPNRIFTTPLHNHFKRLPSRYKSIGLSLADYDFQVFHPDILHSMLRSLGPTDVQKIDLSADLLRYPHSTAGDLRIAHQNALYRNNLQVSIWDRDYITEQFQEPLNAWDFEEQTGRDNGALIVSPSDRCLWYENLRPHNSLDRPTFTDPDS